MGHFVEAKRQGLDPRSRSSSRSSAPTSRCGTCRSTRGANALVSLAGPVAGGVGRVACSSSARRRTRDLLLALAYVGFFLNLFNMIPIGFLDGGHMLHSWRVLRRGGGRADPAAARRLGWVVAALYVATAFALVLGMIAAHVPQHRL